MGGNRVGVAHDGWPTRGRRQRKVVDRGAAREVVGARTVTRLNTERLREFEQPDALQLDLAQWAGRIEARARIRHVVLVESAVDDQTAPVVRIGMDGSGGSIHVF